MLKFSQIVLPDSVTEIGDFAFAWCSGLTSIVIPDSVKHIDSDVFKECDDIVIITPEGSFACEYAKRKRLKLQRI